MDVKDGITCHFMKKQKNPKWLFKEEEVGSERESQSADVLKRELELHPMTGIRR